MKIIKITSILIWIYLFFPTNVFSQNSINNADVINKSVDLLAGISQKLDVVIMNLKLLNEINSTKIKYEYIMTYINGDNYKLNDEELPEKIYFDVSQFKKVITVENRRYSHASFERNLENVIKIYTGLGNWEIQNIIPYRISGTLSATSIYSGHNESMSNKVSVFFVIFKRVKS